MPESAWMHESGPRRPGEGIRTITLHNFPRTAVGAGRDDDCLKTKLSNDANLTRNRELNCIVRQQSLHAIGCSVR
jgi:hypothetical protein